MKTTTVHRSESVKMIFNGLCCAALLFLPFLSINAQSINRVEVTAINASAFPDIRAEVKVLDALDTPVKGLGNSNFNVFENTVAQSPITVKEFGTDSGGVSVVMVMDISRSMSDELPAAKAAATTFVSLMNPLDRGALVSFDATARIVQPFTYDKVVLSSAVNGLVRGSGTSLYDGLMLAHDVVDTVGGKRAIVVLADGRDADSRTTLTTLLNRIAAAQVPIYIIGLGLDPSKGDGQRMQTIANNSGGAFYLSPTTAELEGLYRQISFLISSHYYEVSYTSSNCTEDGTLRDVLIRASQSGANADGSARYPAPGQLATLSIQQSARPQPGSAFNLQVAVPRNSPAIYAAEALDVRITFPATYLQLASDPTQAIRVGTLFGLPSEYVLSQSINAGQGTVELQFQRRSGAGPVGGNGTLFELGFTTDSEMPDSTKLDFTIEILRTDNGKGCNVALQASGLTLYSDGMLVWPGDTNKNGTVELTDVLRLGHFWAMQGPARTGVPDPLAWQAQLARKYRTLDATHADADGGGLIDERDLVPIGVNWGKNRSDANTTSLSKGNTDAPRGKLSMAIDAGGNTDSYVARLFFDAANGAELAGITGKLDLPGHLGNLRIVSGKDWLDSPLLFSQTEHGITAFGVMLTGGESVSGKQIEVLQLHFEASEPPKQSDFKFRDLALVGAGGTIRELDQQDSPVGLATGTFDTFQLFPAYPNPFNPVTTIHYYLPEQAEVQVRILNTLGHQVWETRRILAEGFHEIAWHGRNQALQPVPSGNYFLMIQAAGAAGKKYRAVQKLTLLK